MTVPGTHQEQLAYIRNIANGGEFDTVTAIRTLAHHITHVDPMQGPDAFSTPNMTTDAREPYMTTEQGDITPIIRKHFNADIANALIAAGYTTYNTIYFASDQDLLAIKGVGQATVTKLRTLLADPSQTPNP